MQKRASVLNSNPVSAVDVLQRTWAGAVFALCLSACPGSGDTSAASSDDANADSDCTEDCSSDPDSSSEPSSGVCLSGFECTEGWSESDCNASGQYRDVDDCAEADFPFYCPDEDAYYSSANACGISCGEGACTEMDASSSGGGSSGNGGSSEHCPGVNVCVIESGIVQEDDGSTSPLYECNDDWDEDDCASAGGDWSTDVTCRGVQFGFFCSDGNFYESEERCKDYGSEVEDHAYVPPPGREECDAAEAVEPAATCPEPEWPGDGYCDDETNTAECEWDGGDCCEETCVSADSTCGDNGFSCSDPAVTAGPPATGEPDPGGGESCLVGTFTCTWVGNQQHELFSTLVFEASGAGRVEWDEQCYGVADGYYYKNGIATFTWEVEQEASGGQTGRLILHDLDDVTGCTEYPVDIPTDIFSYGCDDTSAYFDRAADSPAMVASGGLDTFDRCSWER